MENKYYTPSIEEFHVGFEFEWKRDYEDDSEWKELDYNSSIYFGYDADKNLDKWNRIYNINGFICPKCNYDEDKEKNNSMVDIPIHLILTGFHFNENINFRVKYLDKEDIESLGFENYKKDYNLWFRKRIHKEHPGYIYITPTNFHGENSWWIETDTIVLNMDKSFSHNGIRSTIFNGTIKNLSELKVLLKQLGIEYNA